MKENRNVEEQKSASQIGQSLASMSWNQEDLLSGNITSEHENKDTEYKKRMQNNLDYILTYE